MNQLANNFSLLELDVDDAGDHLNIVAAVDANCKRRDGGTVEDKSLRDENLNANGDRQTLESSPGEYKMPLVWIDLEMTGLKIEDDRILEIACVITNGNLTKSIEGPDLVVHQTKECLDKMGEWCQLHHSASVSWYFGLTEKVLQSSVTEQDAESSQTAFLLIINRLGKVMEFVKRHVGTYTPLIAGNSIYMDLLFLKKYMPNLAGLFSHTLVDVSSVKALCVRWYPRDNKKAPQKENKHRAMDDIKESIAELKFYKDHIFKHKSNK